MLWLNRMFYSVRFNLSSVQFATGAPMWYGNSRTRALIAKEYFRAMMGLGTIYALAYLNGYIDEDSEKPTWDSNSSNFGKFKVGNQWIDPLRGISQWVSFISRMTTGKYTTQKGKDYKFPEGNRLHVGWRFFRSKLAPTPAIIVDHFCQGDYNGFELDEYYYLTRVTPMTYENTYQILMHTGMPENAVFSVLSFLGMRSYNAEDNTGINFYTEDSFPYFSVTFDEMRKRHKPKSSSSKNNKSYLLNIK